MNRAIIVRLVIFAVAALSLLFRHRMWRRLRAIHGNATLRLDLVRLHACATTPPPAATSAPTPASAPTQALATVKVGHRVGDQAPDYTLALTGDRQITSADLVAEGKPVFILFHATW